MDAQVDAFGQTEAAAVEEQDDETVRALKVRKDGFDFRSGQDDRDIAMAFGADDAVDLAEIPPEDVAKEEQKGVEGLVLATVCETRVTRMDRYRTTRWPPGV
jgi:hypothetical protein